MNNFYNRPKRKGGFGHLESWFNDTLDLLGILNLDVKRTLGDNRDIVKCVSLRETLDKFANGSNPFVRLQRLKENYDNAGFSQTLEDIKTACGTEILAETCQISLNGREFLTAAEAIYSLLVSIIQVRTTLDYAVKDYEQARRDYLEIGEAEDWEHEWYSSVLFQVGELSTRGLNDETLQQIGKLFNRQKYGYKNWLSSDAVVQQRGVYKDPRQRFHEQGRELRQRSREFGRITRSKSDQTPEQPQPDMATAGEKERNQPQAKQNKSGPWYHLPKIDVPASYNTHKERRLRGKKWQLADAVGVSIHQFETMGRNGTFWIIKHRGQDYELMVKSMDSHLIDGYIENLKLLKTNKNQQKETKDNKE